MLNRMSVVFYVVLFVVITSIAGCGGGGGDSSSVSITPPSQNITGTYMFKSTIVKYSNGITFTEKDLAMSGTMKIGSTTISQSLILNNTPVAVSFPYTSSFNSTTSTGILHVTDASGKHDLTFSISGNDMTTYSGIVTVSNGNTSLSFEEWDTWTKIDNNVATQAFLERPGEDTKASENDNPIQGQYIWIGNLIPQ